MISYSPSFQKQQTYPTHGIWFCQAFCDIIYKENY